MQVHGNANIIVVMSDKQQPKNAFVREQIKDKPKNYKRMWVRLGESAACGGVFALAVCLVLLFMIPVLRQEEGSVPDTGAQDSQQGKTTQTFFPQTGAPCPQSNSNQYHTPIKRLQPASH